MRDATICHDRSRHETIRFYGTPLLTDTDDGTPRASTTATGTSALQWNCILGPAHKIWPSAVPSKTYPPDGTALQRNEFR